MNVAYLLGSLNLGGTETLLLDMLDYYRQAYYDFLIIYRKDGNLKERFSLSHVPIYKINYEKSWMLLIYLFKLRKVFKSKNVNIVHSNQRIDTVLAGIASLGLPIKIVQTIHDFDFKYNYIGKLLIRLSFRLSKWNIFVSKYQEDYYSRIYNLGEHTPKSVVYNGINFDKFNNLSTISIREELSISSQTLMLGMVGNFNPGHDQMTICRFLNLLSLQGFDFRFLFIGKKDDANPQLYDECYFYCQNKGLLGKVFFLGLRNDVPSLLSQIDIFIYSTDYDTFGIAVIEAIASGIPVLTNDWGVMKEITENGKRATIYLTKDEHDLLEKFNKLISDSKALHIKNNENIQWARIKFSIQQHFTKLRLLYCTLVPNDMLHEHL
jgi:glycosyltransferase involved in cell wall biosynthesis